MIVVRVIIMMERIKAIAMKWGACLTCLRNENCNNDNNDDNDNRNR